MMVGGVLLLHQHVCVSIVCHGVGAKSHVQCSREHGGFGACREGELWKMEYTICVFDTVMVLCVEMNS